MDDISKIPRLPGDGARDDSHFQELSKTSHSSPINGSLGSVKSIQGESSRSISSLKICNPSRFEF